VADLARQFAAEATDFWAVSATGSAVYAVVLLGTRSPATHPVPSLKRVDIEPMAFDASMRAWLALRMDPSLFGRGPTTKADAELLKLFSNTTKEDQQLRAFHLARLMKSKRVRDFVVTFADNHGARAVADKLTGHEMRPRKRPVVAFDRAEVYEARNVRELTRVNSCDQ